jgi:hypothetical protein
MTVDSVRAVISAVDLIPQSDVVLTIYSNPITLLVGKASAGGTFTGEATIPAAVGPGAHSLVLDVVTESGIQRSIGTLILDKQLRVSSASQPGVVSSDTEPGALTVDRAAKSGLQIYDALSQPAATSALAVTAAAIVSLMSGGVASTGTTASRKRDAKGKLAGFVTKKLKATKSGATAWGDGSSTWRAPFTLSADSFSRILPNKFGPLSASLPRITVDGSWLRACIGSIAFSAWIIAFFAGVLSGMTFGSVVAPSAMTATVFACLGLLDAGIGMSAWLGTLVGVLIAGSLSDWYDVRTLMGMAVLYTGLAPLAHVIRPLRRAIEDRSDMMERIFDYVITPIFLAFAGGSMLKALNGLSALKLVDAGDVSRAIWFFGILIVVRFAGEDLVRSLYPERMSQVQPQKLTSPSTKVAIASVIPRSVIILFIAVPFFGFTWKTILSTCLLAIPVLMKPFEDNLPNVPFIHRWLPRGLFRFLSLMILGLWLTSVLVPIDDSQAVRNSAVWLLIPGVIIGVIEGFGREGGEWNNTTVKWVLGIGVWGTAVGIVTGMISLF